MSTNNERITYHNQLIDQAKNRVGALPDKTDLSPIIEALTDKGQTVPDGAGVDVLAGLIAAIEAGGGGREFYSGTIIATEKTLLSRFQFSLSIFGGNFPEYMFFWKTSPNTLTDATNGYSLLHCMWHTTGEGNLYHYGKGEVITFYLNSSASGSAPDIKTSEYLGKKVTGGYFTCSGPPSSAYLYAGHEYTWLAISPQL